MSTDFRKFVAPMGTHRMFGLTPQSFIDNMPDRRWTRRNAAIADVENAAFVGVTTDGRPQPGLFALRDEGAPVAAMLNAVASLLALVSPEQREKLIQPVTSKMKNAWQNGIPDFETQGLRLNEVTPRLRDAMLGVLVASLSPAGYERTRNVMRLNGYLGDLVGAPELLGEFCYRLHFFGEPSASAPWGWQFGGHHLCLTCFVLGGQMVLTPTFMGVEPNRAPEGRFAGASVFMDEEYRGLKFAQGLSPDQRRKAVFSTSLAAADLPPGRHHHLDGLTLTGAYQDNKIVPYEGVTGADLNPVQRRDLLDLAESYHASLPAGPLAAKMADLERHMDRMHFCWAGGLENDSVFYYRLQSPVTLIEFDHHWGVVLNNPTPERFHIHTMVRTPNGNDYGTDLLRQHYARSPHHAGQDLQAAQAQQAQQGAGDPGSHAHAPGQGDHHHHHHHGDDHGHAHPQGDDGHSHDGAGDLHHRHD